MRYEKTALSFDVKQQMEIERIAIDEDKDGALEFVKRLNNELNKRRTSHCGVMIDWTPDKKDLLPKTGK